MGNNPFKRKKEGKPNYSVSVGNGAMWADFYVDPKSAMGCYLRIRDQRGTFEQKVMGHTFGYLLTAIEQGHEEEVRNYVYMTWRMSQEIYQDVEFANDIIRAFNSRDTRLMAEGARKAEEEKEEDEGDAD